MPAYINRTLATFVGEGIDSLVGALNSAYANDGFAQQYVSQTKAWRDSLPLLQQQLRKVIEQHPPTSGWQILLEFPLYRLRKRVDAVILTNSLVIVLEVKVGESAFRTADRRQVEEYAFDLRDFHEASAESRIVPCLWCTEALSVDEPAPQLSQFGVSPVQELGKSDVASFLTSLGAEHAGKVTSVRESWDSAPYRPVPGVVEAATALFAGHSVREIAQADASNLAGAATRIVALVDAARAESRCALIFLTGVPGSGKTLAGLQVVHEAVLTGIEDRGDIVYLSGNTPLVTVLREALARDEYLRQRAVGARLRIAEIRRAVRTRIQHIVDFLREYVTDDLARPPHEHAIVFDEAQRAWDERQGKIKFGRPASEPAMLIDLMGRHPDWCALICLVGGGQEINTGENGVAGWGDALRGLSPAVSSRWTVFGPSQVLEGDTTTGDLGLGELPGGVRLVEEPALRLDVPLRSFRSPRVSEWVSAVLDGDADRAKRIAQEIGAYPIVGTRHLRVAKDWLNQQGRGQRRYGLVASSGARRLRADGLGVTLNATDGITIAQWYLNGHGDVRASYALEVTANQYTTQGLELDFVGLCWGGDLLRSPGNTGRWAHRSFQGARWAAVSDPSRQRFITNSYRVLMTRAREGIVLWVPLGSLEDQTRRPEGLDATFEFLEACGMQPIA